MKQNGEPSIWRGINAVPLPLQALVQAYLRTIEISGLFLDRQSLLNTKASVTTGV
jgi:hypothetical protein